MQTYRVLVIVVAISLCAACSGKPEPAAPVQPATARDVSSTGELREVVSRMAAIGWAGGSSFSPDGDRIAYVSAKTGTPQVWIHNLDSGTSRIATDFSDTVTGVRWSPAGDRLAVAAAPGGGLNGQIYLVDMAGGEPEQITEGGLVNNWLGGWSDDGRYLAYSSNAAGDVSMDGYLFDVESGESRLVVDNEGIGTIEDISPNGRFLVAWRMRSRGNTDMYLVDLESGREQLLTEHDGVALSDVARFVRDDVILVATNVGRERVALGRIDIDADGNAGELSILAERAGAELDDVMPIANGPHVALLWNSAGRSELHWFDLDTSTMRRGPDLPAEIAGGLTASADGGKLAMSVSGSATPQNVWWIDVANESLAKASDSAHEGVDLNSLVRPELVRYAAHDGIELTGWLYLPRRTVLPLPVVVSFHGGPEGQERPRFRSTYQALVARGIGVFAPNVRGSSGFGKTFVNLDNGELRFDAVRDIESTVDHLVRAGIADPERVGIMGGSYGGYMVMAGLAEYPNRFAAGANLFGVVNFETFFANTEPWMAAISTVEYGDPASEAEMLRRLSPIHRVDRVVAPTIVLHGANDTNVPVVEAEQVVESLESRGIPVKYVLFPDEGHGWRKTANRVTSDVEIVGWFEAHL